MNAARLRAIIDATTLIGAGDSAEAAEASYVICDLVLEYISVNEPEALSIRAELADMLAEWAPGLKQAPSFILWQAQFQLIGFNRKDQREYALRLIALGKVLGFWDIITPKVLDEGVTLDDVARRGKAGYTAEAGYLLTTGFTP